MKHASINTFNKVEKLPIGEDITHLGYCAGSGERIKKIIKKDDVSNYCDIELTNGEIINNFKKIYIMECPSNSSSSSRRNKQRRQKRRRSTRRR